jgi:hypothetical protein
VHAGVNGLELPVKPVLTPADVTQAEALIDCVPFEVAMVDAIRRVGTEREDRQ